jgi:hypothetical protein
MLLRSEKQLYCLPSHKALRFQSRDRRRQVSVIIRRRLQAVEGAEGSIDESNRRRRRVYEEGIVVSADGTVECAELRGREIRGTVRLKLVALVMGGLELSTQRAHVKLTMTSAIPLRSRSNLLVPHLSSLIMYSQYCWASRYAASAFAALASVFSVVMLGYQHAWSALQMGVCSRYIGGVMELGSGSQSESVPWKLRFGRRKQRVTRRDAVENVAEDAHIYSAW